MKSDFAVLTVPFRRAENDFGSVQQALTADRERVVAFLREQGFSDDEIEVRPLQVQDLLAREYARIAWPCASPGRGRSWSSRPASISWPRRRIGSIRWSRRACSWGVMATARRATSCAASTTSSRSCSKKATLSARELASKFAADAGARLGPLRSANQGAIRITDDDDSDMDTSRTIGKRLRVVSTFQFGLE